tara:strand:+ start:4465 stop:5181 length:717 start_codon:yes stop_codon:yes gene_type:complete
MGLQQSDLNHLVYKILEIDSYASKMGDDKDIVTVAFSVKSKEPAKDLVSFFEKGYNFILDADVTAGEQSDGTYKVFVEMERNKDVAENILEIVEGLKKLTDKEELRFRYYKNFRSHPITLDKLQEEIPVDPDQYGVKRNSVSLENFQNFFNKSYIESVQMHDETLTIKKSYADPLHFKYVDFDDTEKVLNRINETFDVNNFAEIIFLSKYIGDYNISKYGNKLVFDNADKSLVLQRLT